jgi:hypothetical protein
MKANCAIVDCAVEVERETSGICEQSGWGKGAKGPLADSVALLYSGQGPVLRGTLTQFFGACEDNLIKSNEKLMSVSALEMKAWSRACSVQHACGFPTPCPHALLLHLHCPAAFHLWISPFHSSLPPPTSMPSYPPPSSFPLTPPLHNHGPT